MNPIGWCDRTLNPLVGCFPRSEGCKNCYAARLATRHSGNPNLPQYHGLATGGLWTGEVREVPSAFDKKLPAKHQRIFVGSMTDIGHGAVRFGFLDKLFAHMAVNSRHTFLLLTKRPERLSEYLTSPRGEGTKRNIMLETVHFWRSAGLSSALHEDMPWPLPNVWLGATIENQDKEQRIIDLLATPAAGHFVSVEPMLGAIDLSRIGYEEDDDFEGGHPDSDLGVVANGMWLDALTGKFYSDCRHSDGSRSGLEISAHYPRLDWVICGGESGPGARPMHPDWVHSLRDQCQGAGVPFFFKGWGEWGPKDTHGKMTHWIAPNGCIAAFGDPDGESMWNKGGCERIGRIGKRNSGHLIDGRAWREIPEAIR